MRFTAEDLEETESPTLDLARVRAALEAHTRPDTGAVFDLRREKEDSRIVGYVVRPEFRDTPVAERQKWMHQLFDRQFGESSSQIGLMLAFTPEEYAEFLEDF